MIQTESYIDHLLEAKRLLVLAHEQDRTIRLAMDHLSRAVVEITQALQKLEHYALTYKGK